MPEICADCGRQHRHQQPCLVGVLLVCGGRHYSRWSVLCAALDRALARMVITALRHGAAPGADALADRWAHDRRIPTQPCPADWGCLGRAAGPVRNAEMLAMEPRPVVCIAFPGHNGTSDMVSRCRAANIHLWEIP